MLANLGIVSSGIAVMVFKSPLPDLLIGLRVVGAVVNGGVGHPQRTSSWSQNAGASAASVHARIIRKAETAMRLVCAWATDGF